MTTPFQSSCPGAASFHHREFPSPVTHIFSLDGEISSKKTAFSLKFNSAIWILTTGLQFVVGWWYRKSAVFYLPQGWFGPLGWWLAFPFAPAGKGRSLHIRGCADGYTGSVSVGVWQMACKRVIRIGERVVKDLVGTYVPAFLPDLFHALRWCLTLTVVPPFQLRHAPQPKVRWWSIRRPLRRSKRILDVSIVIMYGILVSINLERG